MLGLAENAIDMIEPDVGGVSLPKTRFVCIDGGARQKLDAQQPLRTARWACAGRVLPKRNVSSRFIIIGGIFRKSSSKVMFADHDHMISALTPDRPDQSFNIPVLPGRAERRGPVPDAHCSDASFERAAKCSVIVANEIFRRAVPGECLGNLAR